MFSPTKVWRPRRIFEFKQYKQPGTLPFVRVVFEYEVYGESCFSKRHSSWLKASGRSVCRDINLDHDLHSLQLIMASGSQH